MYFLVRMEEIIERNINTAFLLIISKYSRVKLKIFKIEFYIPYFLITSIYKIVKECKAKLLRQRVELRYWMS